jgi:hypothetical protein
MTTASTTSKDGYTFAGVLLLVLGAFNLIDGFMLLDRSELFADAYVFSNASTWGWILIVFGVCQFVAGAMLARGSGGRTMALTLAGIGMVLWFMLLFTFPFASLIGTAINFSVIASVLSTDPN